MIHSVTDNLMTRTCCLIITLLGITLFSNSAISGPALADAKSTTSLFPTVVEPTDKSLKCIQPEDEMRRNHMNYILHQRDKTVHDGIRNQPGSLSACIDCHVEPDASGNIAGFDSKQHFCSACHQHAAVQIDCFQCHADRPQKYITHIGQPPAPSIEQQLQQTLDGHDKSSEGVTQQ